MTVHVCPFCPLRFWWKSELEGHLREEHRQFHHDYPQPRLHRSEGGWPDASATDCHSDYSPPGL